MSYYQPATTLKKDQPLMPEKSSSWAIGAGSLTIFVSLCLFAAAFGERIDQNMLAMTACVFSLGIMMIAVGVYLRARVLSSRDSTIASNKTRAGGCERCQVEAPVIHCRVHHLHLCGSCLAEHYDFRTCAYVPTTRRSSAKPAKRMAAKARGA